MRCGKIVVVSGCATKVFRVESTYHFADKDKLDTSVVIDEQFIIPPWYDINIVGYADMEVPFVLILELSRKSPQGQRTPNQSSLKVDGLNMVIVPEKFS